ncbi:NAD(P)/FAD-dependent oxidoreductase [Nakamurella deserti]|uniref:NAD(P)/FAD-dependent oxidoreductase n=1 Tax=Nakamurella deserti TaxID=2164074 RepID=UPI000DBE5FBF|nr:FAD-dependent oxidoreductase [Nakamurella deserti]
MGVVVVGAGISGVMCARELRSAGVAVTVLDRGRVVGGRMASKRHDGRPVDTGASYFTVSDAAFDAVVRDWERRGLARPWTDTFDAYSADGHERKTGSMRWAAPAGLRSLVTDLAAELQVRGQHHVGSVDRADGTLTVDGAPADAVVLAMPDPQAARVLSPALTAVSTALTDPFQPVLALTTIFAERSWTPLDGAFVNDHPTINWIADDGRRRGDDAPVLVAHSTPDFARHHLEDPAEAADPMTAALRTVLDLDAEPVLAQVHRWTFGKPAGQREEPYFLGDDLVGVCGDAWSAKPRVESAFLSGRALGRALVHRLGA